MDRHRRVPTQAWLYRGGAFLLLLVLVWSLMALPLVAAPQPQSVDQGKTIFEQKCASCHTIGGGKRVGPDLKGVTEEKDRDWLMRWIANPDAMLKAGDPTAKKIFEEYNRVPMPNLGLSTEEVAAVLAYIESASGGSAAPAPAAPAMPQGNPDRGRALFTGAQPLQNGGPACRSCHHVSALGTPGGGALGSDLDGVVERYNGAEALFAWLQSPATQVMRAVWSDHPLTEQERADLVAFLQQNSAAGASSPTLILFIIALVVFIVFMVIVQLVWRRRLTGVRRPMVSRA